MPIAKVTGMHRKRVFSGKESGSEDIEFERLMPFREKRIKNGWF